MKWKNTLCSHFVQFNRGEIILSSSLEEKYWSRSMLRVTEYNQQTPWKHKGVNHIWNIISMRMTLSRNQIYLIIGFMFAERKASVCKGDLFISRLSGCVDSQLLWTDLIGGTARFRTLRRREVEESGTRWLIINASRRPPDIIFTFSLSRHSAAGVKTQCPDKWILQEGQCRGQSESEACHDMVAIHIFSNEMLLMSRTLGYVLHH